VLYDRGDGVGAMPAAQMAELAGHPRVSVLLGGLASWPGEVEVGQVELQPVKTTFEPRFEAVPTRDELVRRLDDDSLLLLDVRTDEEFRGKHGYPCVGR
jgi:3-mercaptopyruvate sulfurtransferase SseA